MRTLARLLLPLWLVVLLCSIPLAASANAAATVAFSSSTLEIGDTLTVTLNFTGSSVGAVDATLSYDQAVLEFVSGSDASGGGGLVQMTGWASSEVKSLRFTLTFKALKAGSSTVRIDRSTVYAWDETLLGNPTAGATVTVRDVALSQNADLKSITLSAGELYPAFSANTTVYNVAVNNYITSVNLSAVAADSGAKVQISGSSELSVGANKRTITVTAPGGAVKVYTVTITRRQPTTTGATTTTKPTTTTTTTPPSTSTAPGETTTTETDTTTTTAPPQEDTNLTLGDTTYAVWPLTALPEGYTAGQVVIKGQTLPAAKSQKGSVTLLRLAPAGQTDGWYLLDDQTDTVLPCYPLTRSGHTVLVLDVLKGPQGMIASHRQILDTLYPVWLFNEAERADFCLVRAANAAGDTGWYCWDTVEDTLQRYVPAAIPVVTTPLPKKTLANWAPWIIAGGLALLCAALGILAAVFHRRSVMPRPRH